MNDTIHIIFSELAKRYELVYTHFSDEFTLDKAMFNHHQSIIEYEISNNKWHVFNGAGFDVLDVDISEPNSLDKIKAAVEKNIRLAIDAYNTEYY